MLATLPRSQLFLRPLHPPTHPAPPQATAGSRQAVTLALSDRLLGEASRIATAEAVVQALSCPAAEGRAYALSSAQGEGPGTDAGAWAQLFSSAQP